MVLNIGQLRSDHLDIIRVDIEAVVEIAAGKPSSKSSERMPILTEAQTVESSRIVAVAGGDFVKTSTGFAPGDTAKQNLILMRRIGAPFVKANEAGGIRTLDAMIDVLDRADVTATAAIHDEFVRQHRGG